VRHASGNHHALNPTAADVVSRRRGQNRQSARNQTALAGRDRSQRHAFKAKGGLDVAEFAEIHALAHDQAEAQVSGRGAVAVLAGTRGGRGLALSVQNVSFEGYRSIFADDFEKTSRPVRRNRIKHGKRRNPKRAEANAAKSSG